MKAHFPLPEYDGSKFTWSGGVGTCDASDLGLPVGKEPGTRVWNDSSDVGFMVRGREQTLCFLYDFDRRNPDGSIRAWVFLSEDGDFQVEVNND